LPPNRHLIRLPLIALGIALAAVLATACGSGDSAPEGTKTLSFELTDEGCKPASATVPAGPVSFEVENAGTTKVTEFEVLDGSEILGEKENLASGLSGDFFLTLEEGSYTLYCPGGEHERGTLTVTAK
jgi:iron uptake system component EfeO